MRIIKFLFKNFQTERQLNLSDTLNKCGYASYQKHFNIKAAKEVMLENLNPNGREGIWILKRKWRVASLDIVYSDIIHEMEDWKDRIRNINENRGIRNINTIYSKKCKIKKFAKVAKEENATLILEPSGQIRMIF